MQELWKRFKSLTGYNGAYIAAMTNTSRQHVSYLTTRGSTSITHRSAVCMWLYALLDEKISELEKTILDMKQLKLDIGEHLTGDFVKQSKLDKA